MEATIVFKDGTEMIAENHGGNCYGLETKPEFPNDLSIVTVNVDGQQTVLHDALVSDCASVDGKYWFTFTEESDYDKIIRELRENNDMLVECILEMSEIIYGE